MRPGFVLLTLSLLAVAPAPAPAQSTAPTGSVRLVPHRAVYDLSLAAGSRSVDGASGRIAFDFGGDACEGYTLKYRQVTVLESGESGQRTLDVRTATYESGDGKTIRFKTDSRFEGGTSDSVDGDAELRGEALAVRLKQPKPEAVTLPGQMMFPTEHMKRLIEAARAGKTTVSVKVYDGSDDGKKVYDTLALIGRRIEPGSGANLEAPATQEPLAKIARWPMTISYFKAGAGDQTPAYTISFDLYENGISRALKLDYGDFALKGDLANLEILPFSACER